MGHHSTSDWDFNAAYWTLDPVDYISAPSSLRFYYAALATGVGTTLKDPGSLDVKEGQIAFYVKQQNVFDWFCIGFRIDAAPGSSDWVYNTIPTAGCFWLHGYTLQLNPQSGFVGLKRTNVDVFSGYMTHKPAVLTDWNLWRVSYWHDLGGAGLFVRLEYWDGGAWIQAIADINDPADYNYTSGTYRRIGVGAYVSGGMACHYDDIEVYKAS
jgi:hypothetical protein